MIVEGVKISLLPPYVGDNQPVGDIPITVGGRTYRIDPSKINRSGAGSGSMNRLAEFEVGTEGYEIGGEVVTDADTIVFEALAAVQGVIVFAGGSLIPNIVLTTGGRYIQFTPGNNFITVNGGVTDEEHILILTY